VVSERSRDTNISLNGETEKLGIVYGSAIIVIMFAVHG
jgi:hypothetical protein